MTEFSTLYNDLDLGDPTDWTNSKLPEIALDYIPILTY